MEEGDYKKQGRRNKQAGARFELKVRADLENREMIVSKWQNNVDLEKGELIKCKNKFRGINIPMMLGAGFPDFIVFTKPDNLGMSLITGVEVKTNGYLSSIEQEKCKWLLDNNVFCNITIASKELEKGRIKIKYKPFEIKKKDG